jgi:hypothetical protein
MSTIQPRTRSGAPQAHPGDVTGRKRETLQAEHEELLAERAGEIGLINTAKQRSLDDDVVSPFEGTIEGPDGEKRPIYPAPETGPRLIGTGRMKVVELRDEEPEVDPRREDPEYWGEMVTVRFNIDMDDVTLGHGNTFSFKEGQRYKLPRWAAEHLSDKGVIWRRE